MTTHLITRPRAEAEIFAKHLAQSKVESVICPLSEIIFTQLGVQNIKNKDGLIATSANGLKKLEGSRFNLPLYVVGEATAQEAKKRGFSQIIIAGGDSDSLVRLIEAKVKRGSRLLYLGGRPLSKNLALALPDYEIEMIELYRAEPIKTLPPEVRRALEGGKIDSVSFFSSQAAQTFVNLAGDIDFGKIRVFCLSKQIGSILSPLGFCDIVESAPQNVLQDITGDGVAQIAEIR